MLFNFVSIENFGIIKRFSYTFGKNIFVLSGENGHGKSTVFKAILLAVFDDYEGVLSDYVNWESGYFQVIVKFTHRGTDYESGIRYEKSSDRTLCFGDTILKGDEAKKKLKEIADVDLLKAGMLAMEQRIAIVETKPAERREYLKRIYDIEFKRQIADIENDIKASELELAKKTVLQTEAENRKYTIPEKPAYPFNETEYALIASSLETERVKLHAAEENIRVCQQARAELSDLERQSDTLCEDIQKLTVKIDGNKKRIAELPDIKKSAITSETAVLNAASKELDQVDADLSKKAADLNAELRGIILERLPVCNLDEFNFVSQELYAKKAKLSELQSAKDICPACGQRITSPEHIAKRKEEIALLAQSADALTERFTALANQKSRRETAEKSNLDKTNRKTALQHQISLLTEKGIGERTRIQAKIEQSKAKLDRLDAEYLAENNRLAELITADEHNKNNVSIQLDSVSGRILALREKLSETAMILPDDIKKTILKLESDIRSYDDVVSRVAEIERMEKQIALQKEQDYAQIEALKIEIQVLNQMIGDWKTGIKILKTEFPVYVIARVIKDIEKSMNAFLKQTYPKYRVEIQDKKNALHIVYGPKKKDISSASGFERQIFSLSFMYAVNRAIGNKSFLLDECDSAATEKNSEIFYRVLGDSMKQGIDQIILISHKPSTRGILEFDYGAEVIAFENGAAI
jgi:DNA repair exonuclease SbcCD ATPase subunit